MTTESQRDEMVTTGPSAFGDDFESAVAVSPGQVHVIHNVFSHSLPVAGRTVGQVRQQLAESMHIDPQAVGVVDGMDVSDDTILNEGQVLTFIKRAGEKGM